MEKILRKEVGRLHKKLIQLREHTNILREACINKRRTLHLYGYKMKLLKQYDEKLYYRINAEIDLIFPRSDNDILV